MFARFLLCCFLNSITDVFQVTRRNADDSRRIRGPVAHPRILCSFARLHYFRLRSHLPGSNGFPLGACSLDDYHTMIMITPSPTGHECSPMYGVTIDELIHSCINNPSLSMTTQQDPRCPRFRRKAGSAPSSRQIRGPRRDFIATLHLLFVWP